MTDWRSEAACRGVNPDVFHPHKGDREGLTAALAVCAACPVKADCLTYAMDSNQQYGVWGGMSGKQRRELRKTWHRVVPCAYCQQPVVNPPVNVKYCDDCRLQARRKVTQESARHTNYDPKRCPVCTCEFTGGRDCCTPLCARVYRRRQVAS